MRNVSALFMQIICILFDNLLEHVLLFSLSASYRDTGLVQRCASATRDVLHCTTFYFKWIVMDPTRSASLFLIFINHGWMQLFQQKTRLLANSASENAPKTTSTAAPMSALMTQTSATAPLISTTAPPTCKAERESVVGSVLNGQARFSPSWVWFIGGLCAYWY